MILSLLFAAAPALPAAQAPLEPWCELEPVIEGSTWIVLAEVEKVRSVGEIGAHLELRVVETLKGELPLEAFAYLADRGRLVTVGEQELLFLRPPREDGFHYQVSGRVGARSSAREAKLAWLRRALEIRAMALLEQPQAYLDWYQDSLQAGLRWEFWRALSELERLQAKRPSALRQMLSPARLEAALALLEPGPGRKRLEALLRWRKQDSSAG
ncbi:MAG: hypothetical protein H8E31_09785 [Planctomycetes bacterium]|nr:hypothetical protein [Planctomycetota bacterium]